MVDALELQRRATYPTRVKPTLIESFMALEKNTSKVTRSIMAAGFTIIITSLLLICSEPPMVKIKPRRKYECARISYTYVLFWSFLAAIIASVLCFKL